MNIWRVAFLAPTEGEPVPQQAAKAQANAHG